MHGPMNVKDETNCRFTIFGERTKKWAVLIHEIEGGQQDNTHMGNSAVTRHS